MGASGSVYENNTAPQQGQHRVSRHIGQAGVPRGAAVSSHSSSGSSTTAGAGAGVPAAVPHALPSAVAASASTSASSSGGTAQAAGAGAGVANAPAASPVPVPAARVIHVVCPRCRCVVVPPARVFQCPCGQLMTYTVPQAGGTTLSASNVEAMRATNTQVGTSKQLLALFPVSTVKGKSGEAGSGSGGGGASSTPSELEECRICLLEYEDGEEVKTLPCMHRFHSECIDRWLAESRQCPVCKTFVDARESYM